MPQNTGFLRIVLRLTCEVAGSYTQPAGHVFAREEEYARTGYAVDFLEMMADLKNEFEW